MSKHAVERTSPKGQPFVGVCIKCGATGLPLSAVTQECANPANLSLKDTLAVLCREKGAFQ